MQKRSASTRAHLLESALENFAAKGYAATSVDDICADAEMSKGAFYHHFESKQALFLSLLNDWLKTIDSGLAVMGRSTVPETLQAMTRVLPGVMEAASDQLPMFLEFWLQASRDQQVWKASIEPYRHFREYFAGLIARGVTEGSFRKVEPEIASRIIVAMSVGILLQAVLEPEGTDWEKTAKRGMEIMLKGLAR